MVEHPTSIHPRTTNGGRVPWTSLRHWQTLQ